MSDYLSNTGAAWRSGLHVLTRNVEVVGSSPIQQPPFFPSARNFTSTLKITGTINVLNYHSTVEPRFKTTLKIKTTPLLRPLFWSAISLISSLS